MRATTCASRFCLAVVIVALAILTASLACAAQLRIIHLNDLHGWVLAPPESPGGEGLGGAAQLAARVNALRQEKPSLFLAAGDMIQGSSWTNFFKGRSIIDLLNLMKLDAMVVGNHEFDFGLPELQARIKEARFPVLGANVEGVPELQPFVIKEVNGLKVAIIGLVTTHTAKTTNARRLDDVQFLSAKKTLKKFLPQLKTQSDLVIVLSHLGLPKDLKLAAKVPGIDVIVGGHTHTRLNTPKKVGDTIIVQAWEHGKTLGVLDLDIRDGRIAHSQGRLETIQASAPGDAAVQQLVAKYETQVNAALGQVIGNTTVFLDSQNVRCQETNLGDWLADVIRQTAHADLAVLNSGAIRRSLPAGPISLRDIYEVIPFENTIVALKMTGREIRQVLEHSLSRLPKASGLFLQVSGVKLRYDPSAPAGQRLREVQVGGQPLEDDKTYVLATVDFLAHGGDGYAMFPKLLSEAGNPVYDDHGQTVYQVVCHYLKNQKTIAPTLDGRIVADN